MSEDGGWDLSVYETVAIVADGFHSLVGMSLSPLVSVSVSPGRLRPGVIRARLGDTLQQLVCDVKGTGEPGHALTESVMVDASGRGNLPGTADVSEGGVMQLGNRDVVLGEPFGQVGGRARLHARGIRCAVGDGDDSSLPEKLVCGPLAAAEGARYFFSTSSPCAAIVNVSVLIEPDYEGNRRATGGQQDPPRLDEKEYVADVSRRVDDSGNGRGRRMAEREWQRSQASLKPERMMCGQALAGRLRARLPTFPRTDFTVDRSLIDEAN